MGSCCAGYAYGTPRNYFSKEEKIEMLKEYQQSLEKEAKGVKERIQELEKAK